MKLSAGKSNTHQLKFNQKQAGGNAIKQNYFHSQSEIEDNTIMSECDSSSPEENFYAFSADIVDFQEHLESNFCS